MAYVAYCNTMEGFVVCYYDVRGTVVGAATAALGCNDGGGELGP